MEEGRAGLCFPHSVIPKPGHEPRAKSVLNKNTVKNELIYFLLVHQLLD